MRKQLTAITLVLLAVLLAACDKATLPPPATIDLSVGKTATPALAAAIPTATTVPASTTYRVQPGDTLAKIAQQHRVSVEEIVKANGLENPNVIQVGQELVIPGKGQPTSTPAAPATLTPASSAPNAQDPGSSSTVPCGPVLDREVKGPVLVGQDKGTARCPRTEGWQFRADMMVMFGFEALDCAQKGINYGPESEALPAGQLAQELAQAYVQGADLDALAKEEGVKYLWSNVFAYGREIGDMSIGELNLRACSYAEEWRIFDGVDLSPLVKASVVNIADIERQTATGFERRILVVWKEG